MQEAMEKQARGRRKTADHPGNPRTRRVFLGAPPSRVSLLVLVA